MISTVQLSSPYRGSASLTREQFLFYEMRTTAKLICEGLDEESIIKKTISDNLFQYPTEKSLKRISQGCIKRLYALNNKDLIKAIAFEFSDVSKQICLYAMMKQYRLIWEFMVTVIGGKYRYHDFSFSRMDINAFLLRLQEQDDLIASWSIETVKKIASVISSTLIATEYIDNAKSHSLNPVFISHVLESAIRESGDTLALPAFNCIN